MRTALIKCVASNTTKKIRASYKLTTWTEEEKLPIRVERSKSSNSTCGVCSLKIEYSTYRIGTQKCFFKRGIATTWHHIHCALQHDLVAADCLLEKGITIPVPSSESSAIVSNCPEKEDKRQKKKKHKFLLACRAAVYIDTRAHRDQIFKGGGREGGRGGRGGGGRRERKREEKEAYAPLCPITKLPLDVECAHVHHFGPNDFSAITNTFIEQENIDLCRISYTGNQFSSDALAQKFRNFHRK